jgi:hypothetical protein
MARWGKRDRGSVCAVATPGPLRAAKAASGHGFQQAPPIGWPIAYENLREPDGRALLPVDHTLVRRPVSPHWKAAMRFPVILAVAAFALAGCNANQAVNPSSQPPSQVFAGHYEDTNPYNPISYAQNNTGRGGGR